MIISGFTDESKVTSALVPKPLDLRTSFATFVARFLTSVRKRVTICHGELALIFHLIVHSHPTRVSVTQIAASQKQIVVFRLLALEKDLSLSKYLWSPLGYPTRNTSLLNILTMTMTTLLSLRARWRCSLKTYSKIVNSSKNNCSRMALGVKLNYCKKLWATLAFHIIIQRDLPLPMPFLKIFRALKIFSTNRFPRSSSRLPTTLFLLPTVSNCRKNEALELCSTHIESLMRK